MYNLMFDFVEVFGVCGKSH